MLGFGSLLMVGAMLASEAGLRQYLSWFSGNPAKGISMALVAGAVIVGPLAVHYQFTPIVNRRGPVEIGLPLPLLSVTLLGIL